MSSPDPLCTYQHIPSYKCWVCGLLAKARSEEKQKFTRIWQDNLPLIERRNYERGVADGRGLPAL
jgi:hypothetical protein